MITLHTFDLCKQLHELKPHWQPIGAYVIKSEGDEPQLCRDDIHRTCYDWAPEADALHSTRCTQERLDSFL